MRIETRHLVLVSHNPRALAALLESEEAYEKKAGRRIASGVREFLLSGSADYLTEVLDGTEPDPWKFGFAIEHKIDQVTIGLCGFAGPPDDDGAVEIAYSIAPAYQGKGLATEAAGALIEFALKDPRVKKICAHTLADANASTRVLEKCGFWKVREIIDAENSLIWRWERKSA